MKDLKILLELVSEVREAVCDWCGRTKKCFRSPFPGSDHDICPACINRLAKAIKRKK